MTLDPGFTTPGLEEVFSAENRVAQFCRFEAALAEAQAKEGSIPAEAAAAIGEVCSSAPADPEGLLAEGWEAGTPVLVLLERLRGVLAEEHADHLHRGATTQDVVDTALMLQTATALSLLEGSLASASTRLVKLAEDHRHAPTMGRTFFQDAVPTSHGVRFALWAQGVVDVRREIRRVRGRLPLQLGGPVGDAASLGPGAFSLAESMGERLGLVAPTAPWHTHRWPVQETAGTVGRSAAIVSKIASDVAVLTASGEIRVRTGRSSSMSHKRNPVDAIRAEAAAEVSRVAAAGLMASPAHVLERGMGPWHAEWALLPLALQCGGAAAESIARCLASLEVETGTTDAEVVDTGLIERVLGAHRSLEAGR